MFYGKARQCGPAALRGNTVAGFCRPGHGVQRVCRHSQRTLPLWIFFPSEAAGMGSDGFYRDARRNEAQLSAAEASCGCVFAVGAYDTYADLGVLPRSRSQYAPVDSPQWIFFSAVGAG